MKYRNKEIKHVKNISDTTFTYVTSSNIFTSNPVTTKWIITSTHE